MPRCPPAKTARQRVSPEEREGLLKMTNSSARYYGCLQVRVEVCNRTGNDADAHHAIVIAGCEMTVFFRSAPGALIYAFFTNSDFNCMAPMPSILQSIS